MSKKKYGDPNKRCGPECQWVMPQHSDKGVWELDPNYYPVLKKDPTACSETPSQWLRMSTPESIRKYHDRGRW